MELEFKFGGPPFKSPLLYKTPPTVSAQRRIWEQVDLKKSATFTDIQYGPYYSLVSHLKQSQSGWVPRRILQWWRWAPPQVSKARVHFRLTSYHLACFWDDSSLPQAWLIQCSKLNTFKRASPLLLHTFMYVENLNSSWRSRWSWRITFQVKVILFCL